MLDVSDRSSNQDPIEELRSYIKSHDLSERGLSRLCGVSTSTLNGILRMQRRPSAPVAVRLEQHTGISAEKLILFWETKKVRQEIRQVISEQKVFG